MSEVYITRSASFLPNEPVSNDEMEAHLGMIGDRASKSRRIVLRNNGIKQRYYALDKEGQGTHTNAEIASLAIRELMDNDPDKLAQIDILSCGTSIPDQMMPSHSVMVHGWLPETGNIEVVSPAGNCCSGMHALKYAFMSLKLDPSKTAVCSGSERLSRALHSDHFEIEIDKLSQLEGNPNLAFEKDFLRWMLSDGGGAFLLQTEKNQIGPSLRIDWIDVVSFANEADTCMYMASDKDENGALKSFMDYTQEEINEKSIYSVKQDVKILGENIVQLGFKKLVNSLSSRNLTAEDIAYFIPHMSSYFFEDKIAAELKKNGLIIPKEKWFTNLDRVGNIGAGSVYLMIDELLKENKLKKGDKILLAVPESARFSYVFSMLTVC